MAYRFHILIPNFKEHIGKQYWSYDLETHGNNINDLLDNATFIITDGQGFYLDEEAAITDEDAVNYIKSWFDSKRLRRIK